MQEERLPREYRLKRKLDRVEGDPSPDPISLRKADAVAKSQVIKAQEAAEKAARQRVKAEVERGFANFVIDALKAAAKRQSNPSN